MVGISGILPQFILSFIGRSISYSVYKLYGISLSLRTGPSTASSSSPSVSACASLTQAVGTPEILPQFMLSFKQEASGEPPP